MLSIENEAAGDGSSLTAQDPTNDDGWTTVIIEVRPDELPTLALAQRIMYTEIYPSQIHTQPEFAEVRNIIDNYTGIVELRGNKSAPREIL